MPFFVRIARLISQKETVQVCPVSVTVKVWLAMVSVLVHALGVKLAATAVQLV
jgi:hypothetical protein